MLCFLLCGTGAMPSTKIPLPMLNNAYISKKDCWLKREDDTTCFVNPQLHPLHHKTQKWT